MINYVIVRNWENEQVPLRLYMTNFQLYTFKFYQSNKSAIY